MRRRTLVAVALVAPLWATSLGGARATEPPRYFYDAVQVGTTGDDRATGVAFAFRPTEELMYLVGDTSGQLPGQANEGGDDVFVRTYRYEEGGLAELATEQLGSAGDDHVAGAAVASSPGALVTAGTTAGALLGPHGGGTDAWLRFDFFGSTWTDKEIQFGAAGDDGIVGIASGHGIYVVGYRTAAEADGTTGLVQKYDEYGALAWERDVDAAVATQVVESSRGARPLLVAEEIGPPSMVQHRIAALDPDTGDELWATGWSAGRVLRLSDENPGFVVTTPESIETFSPGGNPEGTRPVADLVAAGSGPHVIVAGWYQTVVVRDLATDAETLVQLDEDHAPVSRTAVPGGMAVAGVSWRNRLVLYGSTEGDLDGPNAGGSDAAVARFARLQPDAIVGEHYEFRRAGEDVYLPDEQVFRVRVRRGETAPLQVLAGNDGEITQRFRLKSCGDHAGYRFRYGHHGKDVKRAITRGRLSTGRIGGAPFYAEYRVYLDVTALRAAKPRTTCVFTVSSPETGLTDTVKIRIRRR